jgi:outer membrane protein, heavy metal efflux system
MQSLIGRMLLTVALGVVLSSAAPAQGLNWEQVKTRFETTNPTLKANQLNIDESRAAEITAFLRPNPQFTLTADGFQLNTAPVWRPLSGVYESPGISYLHERQHKRELRLDSARESTEIAKSTYQDQERGLIFNLRSAFVQVLQAKAFLENARENLSYWDRELGIFRQRFQAGDLAQIDIDRLELQRIPFESDYETALVNLRTAKIQLLMMLDDHRTPVDQFDVSGPFDFSEGLRPLEEYRNVAVETRPDLKAAVQNVDLAKINHDLAISNGSTDPTYSMWYSHNPSFSNAYANNTIGGSISIPLRIFDRNQGEKARTQVDIGRNERLKDANEAQVYSDVDSAYYTLLENINLLRPYKAKYLELSIDTRNKVSFAYQNGGASLLDFLDAEEAYRSVRLAYLNLIGSYLTTAAQMNMAVGREVI